jgi:lysozyme family protein
MASKADFDRAFDLVIGHEGGYTSNPNDPGNWTGGAVGKGECKGTKYGVSAASYPTLDIKNLTLAEARDIYHRDYWTAAHCPELKPRVAFVMFDCAINNGVGRAIRFLQAAVGAAVDGAYRPITAAAVARADASDADDLTLAAEVHAQRINFMAGLDTWKSFGMGWSRRLASLPLQAAHYWPAA